MHVFLIANLFSGIGFDYKILIMFDFMLCRSGGPSIASGLDSRKSSLMQSYDTQYCPVTQ